MNVFTSKALTKCLACGQNKTPYLWGIIACLVVAASPLKGKDGVIAATKKKAVSAANMIVEKTSRVSFDLVKAHSVRLDFAKNQKNIDRTAQATLLGFIESIKGRYDDGRFYVAVWSDTDLPVQGGLASSAQRLAAKRFSYLKRHIQHYGKMTGLFTPQRRLPIQVINMTVPPAKTQDTTTVSGLAIKRAFVSKHAQSQEVADYADLLRMQGGAYKAVVIFRPREFKTTP